MQRQGGLADGGFVVEERNDHSASPPGTASRKFLARLIAMRSRTARRGVRRTVADWTGVEACLPWSNPSGRQRRWDGDAICPGSAVRLAGRTVPTPGSEVDVLAPRSAQDLRSSSA